MIFCDDGTTYYFYSNVASNQTIPHIDPSKPSILMLHGFSADKDIWLKLARYAYKDYQLIIPDFKGHGAHLYHSRENYSAMAQAEYINHLLSVLYPVKSTQLLIVGNSMGGMVAAILGQINDCVTKLVLLDPAGAKSDFARILAEKKHNPFLHDTVESAKSFFKNTMYKPPFVPPSVLHYLIHKNYLSKSNQYKHMFTDFFDIDSFFSKPFTPSEKYPPSLIVWGEKDALLPASDAVIWQKLVNGKMVILPNIGHMPMVECPKQVFKLLKF
ncbi:alpha/beta fold hydrolase [Glaciecola petra]|uniref:Alpha/beta hydrolase n=1 Tax=Glaciecola petra TaxID=3075602 RepID=A0ABU2ZNP4_9ALTE|nr:alpha/beta hydrolase [Aestuariibacter sp. P117]MDT0594242.1 alpha/beta hydrolase [Aestuariibacter sp. P117]